MNKAAISVLLNVAKMIGLTAIALISSNAMAANRIFPLHLQNIDSQPITFEIVSVGPCYQGTPGQGEKFMGVAPGSRVTITLARIQGHGCDGKGGELAIKFIPGDGHREVQNFQFDNGGSLWLMPGANTYPGKLSPKARDESFTYTTVRTQRAVVTAGKAIGNWESVCEAICNRSKSLETSTETGKDSSRSQETVNAVSLSLEAGVEFGPASVRTTATASQEKRIGQTMSESFRRGEKHTDTSNYVFSPEQMRDLNIYAVWQWVARTRLSTGEEILVRSNRFTCSADADPPKYLPGSAGSLQACRGGLATVAQAAPPAAQAAPAAPPQPDPQQAAQQHAAQQLAQQQAAQQQAAQQLAARKQATQQRAPTKGQNVTAIEFGHLGTGGAKLGHYRQTGPREWSEVPNTGPIVFRFEETQRDEWSVYMIDRSRGVNLQLDLYTRKVMYSDAKQPRRELYNILGASAP